MSSSSDNKRIAQNTVFLYIRMIVVMLVTLYTTRIVLNILGETDYGIYNIVGGVIVLFSFIQTALSIATQRFLSFALGKNDFDLFKSTFSSSLLCFVILVISIVFLGETIGLYFLNTKLSFPEGSVSSANIVYQCTIATFVISMLRIPFEAAVISFEKMSFFAYVSVVEAILKLGMIFLLMILPGNKLIDYAIVVMIIPLGSLLCYYLFCTKKIGCSLIYHRTTGLFKELFSYSGWSLLGASSNVMAKQGGNILLNIFFGVTVNAAYGISNQVNNAVTSLVGSFQTAFRPQIIKLYASNEKDGLYRLCFQTSAWSAYLVILFVIPLAFNIQEILSFWLVKVPDFSGTFIIWLFAYCYIDAMQTPLIVLISATGNVKVYQIWLSALIYLNLPLSYIAFKSGYSPVALMIIYTLINLTTAIVRTYYVNHLANFPSGKYIRKIVSRIIVTTIISLIAAFWIEQSIPELRFRFVYSTALLFISTATIIYIAGFNISERKAINKMILKRIKTR